MVGSMPTDAVAWLISCATTIGTSLTVGFLVYTIKKHDKRAEARQHQIIEQWKVEKRYNDCTGELAYRTAMAVHKAELCNGEVMDKIEEFEEAKNDRSDFYRDLDAYIAVKG